MGNYLVPAATIGIIWMVITSRLTPESFLVGFIVGLAVVTLMRPRQLNIRWQRLPDQVFALVLYILILLRDIILSGLDVARRVLSPDMRLQLGIIAVETQDEQKSALIAALSADVITLTPGELVVEVEGNHTLYVHCLDVADSSQRAERQQAQRLKVFKRILGRTS